MQKTTLILQPLPASTLPPAFPEPTNEALIAAVQEGDGKALWLLFHRHADLLRGVISRELTEESDCESVLRQIFEDLRDRAVHYTPDKGRAIGWLMTVARRRAKERASQLPAKRELPALQLGFAPVEEQDNSLDHGGQLTPAFA